MSQQQTIEQQLWSYIDGLTSIEEKSSIEKLLESNQEWKKKYKELLDIHQLMNSSDLEQPSMRFTKNVMEEISKFHIAPATKNYINNKIIWGIGGFFITLITGFLIYGFMQIDWTDTTASTISTQKYVNFDNVNFGKIFNNTFVNAFMMVNVLLGLFFLDRFLANKRKKYREEA